MFQLSMDISREITEILQSFENLRLHELSEVTDLTHLYTAINTIGSNLEKSYSGLQHINEMREQARIKVVDAERDAQHIRQVAQAEANQIKEIAQKEANDTKEIAQKQAKDNKDHTARTLAEVEIIKKEIKAIKKDTEESRDGLRLALEAVKDKAQNEITPPQSKKRSAATDGSPARKKKRTKSSWTEYSSKITTLCSATRPNKSLSGYNQFLNLVPYIIDKEDSIDKILKFLGEDHARSCLNHVVLSLEGDCDFENHICEYVEVVDGRLVMI